MGKTVGIKYSEGFKLKVVEEYEKGKYTINELRKRYGVGGKGTVAKWVMKLGKGHLLSRKVVIMSIEERSEVEALKEEVRQLREVISHQKIEVLALESLFEVAGEEFGIEFKKNCLRRLPPEVRQKLKDL